MALIALATWWYEDGVPTQPPLPGFTVEVAVESGELERIAALPPGGVAARRDDGHRPYVARFEGEPVAFGWVATVQAAIGELGLAFSLPTGNRYLWGFATLPEWRDGGIDPLLLAEIVRRESPPATRLWLIRTAEHLPSGAGIEGAGFETVAELSSGAGGRPALRPVGDRERATAGAQLLGLPLIEAKRTPRGQRGAPDGGT